MPYAQPWSTIPANEQKPGALLGGLWVVMQAWAVRNHWTMGLLGPEGAKITNGYGDWETVQVPRDRAITEWRGRRNYEMDIDLLYDGWITHPVRPALQTNLPNPPKIPLGVKWNDDARSVWIENLIAELESMAVKQPGDSVPHSLRLFGAVPHPELRWAIQNLAWGDSIRDKATGRRLRQQVTVHLIEFYQPPDLRSLPKPKPKPQPKKKPQVKTPKKK